MPLNAIARLFNGFLVNGPTSQGSQDALPLLINRDGSSAITKMSYSSLTGAPAAVSLSGQNYLGLTGTAFVANAVDLSGTNATGTLAAARFPALTGDVTSIAGALGMTLATVNGSPGTFTKVVVNGKGLVTSGGAISSSDIISALGFTPANSGSLGTAAFDNVGTADATIPLLNGANTWSAQQVHSAANPQIVLGVASSIVGGIQFKNATNANTLSIQAGIMASSLTFTLPTADSTGVQALRSDGAGNLSFGAIPITGLGTLGAYSVLGNNTSGPLTPVATQVLILGTPSFAPGVGSNFAQITGNVNSYGEVIIQNTSANSSASTDFIVTADNGTDSTVYGDFGINSSLGGGAPFTNINAVYLYSATTSLEIGCVNSSGVVNISTGATPTRAIGIDQSQNVTISGPTTHTAQVAASAAPWNLVNSTWTVSGGTGTTTYPQMLINGGASMPTTLSTAGTGILINAPSGFGGNPFDYRVNGGVSLCSINSSGTIIPAAVQSGGFVTVGAGSQLNWSGRTQIRSNADGTLLFTNNASTGFVSFGYAGPTAANTAGSNVTIIGSQSTGTGSPGTQTVSNGFAGLSFASVVTITVASPAVFSLTAHGFVPGQSFTLTTTGTLPTGLATATTYYVIATGLTANAFEISASPGGSAVNTTGTQSGVHTATATTTVSNPASAVGVWGPSGLTGSQTIPGLAVSQTLNTSGIANLLVVNAINNIASSGSSTLLALQVAGSNVFSVALTGATTVNSTLTATGNLVAGAGNSISCNGHSKLSSATDGIWTMTNNVAGGFTRLQLGGTTASFPAIKVSSTTLAFRLADDSADCPITAAGATFSGAVNITGLTASQIVGTDASKNLVSLATVSGALGGTGVANTGFTITLGGNLVTSGAFGLTLTQTAATNVTLPISGTLVCLSLESAFTAQQYFAQQSLTDASTITWNCSTQQAARVLLTSVVGETRVLGAPSNPKAGSTYTLIVVQSSTGSNALTFNAAYKFPGGIAPTLSTANNAVDILTFISDGTSLFGVAQKAFA